MPGESGHITLQASLGHLEGDIANLTKGFRFQWIQDSGTFFRFAMFFSLLRAF
jgi:hypothetical protein